MNLAGFCARRRLVSRILHAMARCPMCGATKPRERVSENYWECRARVARVLVRDGVSSIGWGTCAMPYEASAAERISAAERNPPSGAESLRRWAEAHPGAAFLLVGLLLALVLTGLAIIGVTQGGANLVGDDYFATDDQQMIENCASYSGADAEARYDLGQSSVAARPGRDSEGNGFYTVTLRDHDRNVVATCTVEQTPERFIVGPGPR